METKKYYAITTSINLGQDAESETIACIYADADGILNLSDSDAEYYQIINNENEEEK